MLLICECKIGFFMDSTLIPVTLLVVQSFNTSHLYEIKNIIVGTLIKNFQFDCEGLYIQIDYF
jgi:hypothetical protein